MTSATAAAADDDDNEDSDNSDTDITDINCKIIETINKKTKKIHMHTKAVGLFKAGFPHKWQTQISWLFSTKNPRKSRPIPVSFTGC